MKKTDNYVDINDVTNCYMIIAHYIYIYAGPSTGEDQAGNLPWAHEIHRFFSQKVMFKK